MCDCINQSEFAFRILMFTIIYKCTFIIFLVTLGAKYDMNKNCRNISILTNTNQDKCTHTHAHTHAYACIFLIVFLEGILFPHCYSIKANCISFLKTGTKIMILS